MKHGYRQVLSEAAWAIAFFTTEEWNLLRTKQISVQCGVLKLPADALVYACHSPSVDHSRDGVAFDV